MEKPSPSGQCCVPSRLQLPKGSPSWNELQMEANVGHNHDSYLYCKLQRFQVDILLSRSKAQWCKAIYISHIVYSWDNCERDGAIPALIPADLCCFLYTE